MKATQNLVDKRILAPLTIVKEKDSGKGNPLRNKLKKKKRLHQELAKFDEELLRRIPPEKLAQLLENQPEDGDHDSIAASLRTEIKQLVAQALKNGDTQKEIVSINPPPSSGASQYPQLPSNNSQGVVSLFGNR